MFPLAVNLARQHCSSEGTEALTAVKTAVGVIDGGSSSEVSITTSQFTLVNSGLKREFLVGLGGLGIVRAAGCLAAAA